MTNFTLIFYAVVMLYTIWMSWFLTRLMKTPTVKFTKELSWVIKPTRATKGSAGFDFYLPDNQMYIPPKTTKIIDTHVFAHIPKNFVMTIHPRSSIGIKNKLMLANTTAVIDSDYKDTIKIALYNYGNSPITLKNSERFAQAIITPYITDGRNVSTTRNGGIGSTGRS